MKKLAPTQVELVIPISAQELQSAQERAFRKLAKKAKLPGFRPGKVPRKVFEQAYGRQTIDDQALEDLVPSVYAQAVREHEIDPIDRPKMELLPDEEGQPMRVKAVVEVRPHFDLAPYKALSVTRPAAEILDAEVDRTLETLARDRAALVPAEREARLGDVVTIDYEGRIDDVPFEGGTAKAQTAELLEERFIPGFASGIAGMQAGETRTVEANFPDDYQQPELAGKHAEFTITLHEVKERELPAIDDAFAKAVSENATLDSLRSDVRKRLEAVAEAKARRDMGNQVVEQVIAANDIPVPDSLVERQIDSMLDDLNTMAQRSGVSFDAYLESAGKTPESLREEYREEARRRVRGTLVLEAIAKAEKIAATPADVQAEMQALAVQYGQPLDRIREALGSNLLALRDGIVRNKTVEFLIDNATVETATMDAPT